MEGKNNTDDWLNEEERRLFGRVRPTGEAGYSRSAADVWAALERGMGAEGEDAAEGAATPTAAGAPAKQGRVVPLFGRRLPLAVAASVSVLLALGLMARFYTRTVRVGAAGELAMHVLPDGSLVQLNTETEMRYQPYWWWANRRVELDGEAFFEVERGSTFTVQSAQGRTEVLGTSFNIRARGAGYAVYCRTGRVRVTSASAGGEVVLTPGLYTERTAEGLRPAALQAEEVAVLGWRANRFVYNTTPLPKVVQDMERYFEVQIDVLAAEKESLFYTGTIGRDLTAVEVLQVLCFSFNLSYEVVGESAFILKAE